MTMAQFHFAKLENIEKQNFDNSLEQFNKSGIEGTIRENIQNSIDAKLANLKDPVKVKIQLTTIEKDDVPDIQQLEKHILSLDGGSSYTKKTIDHMKKSLNKKKMTVLTFEDINTKGLSGAEMHNEETTYYIFAYKNGVHYEESNSDIETVRGGSHGVGKISNNAVSDLHLMYFANCDEKGQKNLGGTIQLIEHKIDEKCCRATGYFAGRDKKEKRYIANVNQGYHPVFNKNTRGLKIIIPYLREEYNDIARIVQAVCDNFFLAILKDELTVQVKNETKTIEINKETIKRIVADSEYYPQNMENIEEIKKIFTPLYIENFLTQTPQIIKIGVYQFELYFLYNPKIKAGRVGIVRSMGMKIVDYKVQNNVRKPFNAILIGGAEEDAYLKSLENESHTDISEKSLRDNVEKRNARRFLRELRQQITSRIDEEFEKLNPSDNRIDTKDLFFKTETHFRGALEKQSEKVEIAKGKFLRKKKIIEKINSKENFGNNSNKSEKNRKRIPRKVRSTNNKEKEAIIAPNELVERIVLADKEIIHFNFVGVKEVIPLGKVNISLRVVNGDGREYDDELDMLQAYQKITDTNTHENLKFSSSMIYNVPVVDSQINLYLYKKSERTDRLKFVYKVEVLS